MHLLIDGYNLLGFAGRMRPGTGGAEGDRELLLRELAGYRQRKGHPITVVFDGWRHGPGAEHHEYRTGLEVIYSRRGEKADAVLQRLARDYGAACAVVSSDREVADHARAQGAFVLSAAEFAASLRGQRLRPSAAEQGARSADEEPATRAREKKGNPRKLPKRLRQRRQQLRRF